MVFMIISTILIMTHSFGDTDGDTDGLGDLGIHGTDQYGGGPHLIIGTIGDVDLYGEEDFMVITTLYLTNTIREERLPTDLVLEKEYVQV